MSQTIARRYARALYESAEQQRSVEQVDADMALILESLKGSPELGRFLADPILNVTQKTGVVQKLFSSRVSPVMMSFLNLLIEKRREGLFLDVASSYQTLRDTQLNIVRAEARVALALEPKETEHLTRAIERLTGRTVKLETQIDPSIIGGVIIRVGDTVYDRSVRNQLTRLKDQLEQRALQAN